MNEYLTDDEMELVTSGYTPKFKIIEIYGAGGGGRTRTLLPGLDFESSTSANSITPANNIDIITNLYVKVNYKI